MSNTLVVLVSWAAVTAGALATAAQYRRVSEQGIEGVSLATWLLFSLIGGFWITYGAFSAHSMPIIIGSLLCWPLQLAIVFRLAPARHRRGSLQGLGVFVVCCIAPAFVGGWSASVFGTGLAMTLLRWPQFVHLVRTSDASGVSASSWFMGVGCSTLWVIYYGDVHLWAPLIATTCSGMASAVIGCMAVWRHRQSEAEMIRREVFAS
ncbi:MAG TPA: hypothetical protein VIJ86_01690 [Acidimicrobiales bacterium]